MFSWKKFLGLSVSFFVLLLTGFVANGQSDGRVYAVLFFSPTCPHCHQVIGEDLPPIQEQFGDGLVVFMVDVTTSAGQVMVQSAYDYYNIAPDNRGVPMMIIDEQILVGSVQIPTELPEIVEIGLLNGGIPIPQFPMMKTAYESWLSSAEVATPIANDTVVTTSSPFYTIVQHDPIASGITVLILVGLIISSLGISFTRRDGFPLYIPQLMLILTTIVVTLLTFSILLADETNILALSVVGVAFVGLLFVSGLAVFGDRVRVAVVLLTVVGLVISGYMAYVEMTANPAVCGVIGDCNAVQQSEYAFIFGVPIGVIGLLGYLFMLFLSLIVIASPSTYRHRFVVMLQTVVIVAGAFTIYLTFLEPFVIGAVCVWCLLSSLVVMNLMWLVLPMVKPDGQTTTEYLMYQPQAI